MYNADISIYILQFWYGIETMDHIPGEERLIFPLYLVYI